MCFCCFAPQAVKGKVREGERFLLFDGEGCRGRNGPAAQDPQSKKRELFGPRSWFRRNRLLRLFGLLDDSLLDGLSSRIDGPGKRCVPQLVPSDG